MASTGENSPEGVRSIFRLSRRTAVTPLSRTSASFSSETFRAGSRGPALPNSTINWVAASLSSRSMMKRTATIFAEPSGCFSRTSTCAAMARPSRSTSTGPPRNSPAFNESSQLMGSRSQERPIVSWISSMYGAAKTVMTGVKKVSAKVCKNFPPCFIVVRSC